jgi:predicted DNA-binding WGR domain protein
VCGDRSDRLDRQQGHRVACLLIEEWTFGERVMSDYRFELRKGRSQKFWEISHSGKTLRTRWGRIGSAGQSKKKSFKETEPSIIELNRLIQQKVAKGYERVFTEEPPKKPAKLAAGRKHATRKDVLALLEKTPKAFRTIAKRWRYLMEEGVELHEGDLTTAKLVVGPRPLVVTGNLRVRGLLSDGHKADETLLVVLGDLEAKNIATFGAILVARNAKVREVVYGFSAHDRIFLCGGALSARCFLDGDHWVQVLGRLKLELLVGSGLLAKNGKPRRTVGAHEALVKRAWEIQETDEDGTIITSRPNRDVVRRLMMSGKSVLA